MHANLHISTISRGAGRNATAASAYRSGSSVVACAAYRACEKLKDNRYQKTHDYSRKQNVLHTEIITPPHAPEWMKNRQSLWNVHIPVILCHSCRSYCASQKEVHFN